MAITYQSTNTLVGLSSDTKPTTNLTASITMFFETDTRLWYNWNGTAWMLLGSVQQGGALYTALIAGTTTKLRNNITGAVDYTADNTVNSVTAFNSAFANMVNFANMDGEKAGWIDVTPGLYKCTTMLNLTSVTNLRHGIGLKGNGPGTVFNFVPGSALTDAIRVTETYGRLEDFTINPNANVTNVIRVHGNNPNGDATYGRIRDVSIVGPNINTTVLPVTNQVGILFDGTLPSPFHWIVDGLDLYLMDIGIKHLPIYGTSAHVDNFMFWGCNVGADVDAVQNFYTNGYIQGQVGTTHTGIRLRDESDFTVVDNVITEVRNTTPTGAAQSILIDSGAQGLEIDHVSNSYENGTTIKTVVNNSANLTNKIGYRDNFAGTLEIQKVKASSFESIGNTELVFKRNAVTIMTTDTNGNIDFTNHGIYNIKMYPGGLYSMYDSDFSHFYVWQTGNLTANVDIALPILAAGTNTFLFDKMPEAQNIVLGTTTGTKIGTATNQKLGFFNATPIVQKAANANTSSGVVATVETEVNEIKQLLRDYGLLAP